jgi:hypothetical protein
MIEYRKGVSLHLQPVWRHAVPENNCKQRSTPFPVCSLLTCSVLLKKPAFFQTKARYWEHQYFLTGAKIILINYKYSNTILRLSLILTQKREKRLLREKNIFLFNPAVTSVVALEGFAFVSVMLYRDCISAVREFQLSIISSTREPPPLGL